MILLPPIHYRLSTKSEIIVGIAFLLFSLMLVLQHALRVSEMRDIGLPSAMRVPTIEQRLEVLKEQSDAVELQANLSGGQNEEALQAYVLPDDGRMDRALSTLDTLLTTLRKQGHVHDVSALRVGDAVPDQSLMRTPITFDVNVDEEGMNTITSLIRASGLITVNDALSDTDRSTLLKLTEQENPAAVTSLETFLATDLLAYLNNSKPFDEQLLQSFSSDVFGQSFRTIIGGSSLSTLQHTINLSLRQALGSQKLWPLPFMNITHTDIQDTGNGWLHVALTVEAVARVK